MHQGDNEIAVGECLFFPKIYKVIPCGICALLLKASQFKRVQKASYVDNTGRVAQFGGVLAKQTGLWHGTAPQACLMR